MKKLTVLGLVLLLSACGLNNDDEEMPYYRTPTQTQNTQTTTSFRWLATNVFGPKCGTCHNWTNYNSVMQQVQAGDPQNSMLYYMVASGQMPKQGTKLSQAHIQAIWTWIQQGARNN